jgi:hypothetical protein
MCVLKLQEVLKDVLNRAMETANKLQPPKADGNSASAQKQDTSEQTVKENIELKRYASTHIYKKWICAVTLRAFPSGNIFQ